ncbi:hypothetical protein M501DRAFT_1016237 [Patellaria atrata CBS 101060]|uniref:Uncharacterized protein n=1 Tax=Patellaria atrata CBS 101060 TaxID=1346257 RepID=A0A9P4SB19_9PEZI|nr:hypothetical protein M501DRAFT_1016237 [Patellaria atrata CBS 101060]
MSLNSNPSNPLSSTHEPPTSPWEGYKSHPDPRFRSLRNNGIPFYENGHTYRPVIEGTTGEIYHERLTGRVSYYLDGGYMYDAVFHAAAFRAVGDIASAGEEYCISRSWTFLTSVASLYVFQSEAYDNNRGSYQETSKQSCQPPGPGPGYKGSIVRRRESTHTGPLSISLYHAYAGPARLGVKPNALPASEARVVRIIHQAQTITAGPPHNTPNLPLRARIPQAGIGALGWDDMPEAQEGAWNGEVDLEEDEKRYDESGDEKDADAVGGAEEGWVGE